MERGRQQDQPHADCVRQRRHEGQAVEHTYPWTVHCYTAQQGERVLRQVQS